MASPFSAIGRPRHEDVLTPAEWDVLAGVRDGLSNREIALQRGCGLETVRFHLRNVRRKLRVQSRAALRAFPGRASEAIERAAERPARRVREQIPLVEIRDMGRSLAFYVDLLGFRVVSRWPDDEPVPGWAALAAGAARIMLRTGARPPRTPGGAVTLNLYVEGIDAFRDSIAAAGVRCGPVRSLFYGAREFSLRDPEGNEIAIVEFGASEPGYLASSTDGDEKEEAPNEGG